MQALISLLWQTIISARYNKKKENRIFIFNRDKDYIFPKWLGSKIGDSVIDFKIDRNANKLIILEKLLDKPVYRAVSYKWNGFGFDSDEVLSNINNLNNKKIQFHLSGYKFISIK